MKSQNQVPPVKGALTIADAFQRTMDYLEAKGSPGRLFSNSLSIEQQLPMYALYKQIKHGDCDEETPSKWNYKAYRKQQAWDEFRGTSKAQAQRDYVNRVIEYSQDVSGLEGLIEKCQGWLDQVEIVDDAEPAQQAVTHTKFDTKAVSTTSASAAPANPSAPTPTTSSPTAFRWPRRGRPISRAPRGCRDLDHQRA